MARLNEKYLSWLPEEGSIQQDPSVLPQGFDARAIINVDASGVLYRAVRTSDQRKVTLKVLPPDFTVDPHQLRISHDSLAEIEEIIKPPNGSSIVVLEHLRGTSLEGIISKQRRLKTDQAITIARKLLSAVAAVHRKGQVLNCISPGNIFLSRSANGELDIDVVYIMIDGADTVLNDPEYLSPEQLSANMPPDAAADLWAVSIILYELAFGGHPFAGRSKEETLGRIMDEEITIPPLLARTKPALAEVIYRALRKEPQNRFQRARDMIAELDEILPGVYPPLPLSSAPAKPIPSVPAPSAKPIGKAAGTQDAFSASVDDEITEERITLEVLELRPSQIRALEKNALSDEDGEGPSEDGERPLEDGEPPSGDAQVLNTPTVPAPVSSTPPEEAYPSEPDMTERSIRSTQIAQEERRQLGRSKPRRGWFVFGIGAIIATMASVGIWAYARQASHDPSMSEPSSPETAGIAPVASPVSEKSAAEDMEPTVAEACDEAGDVNRDTVVITVENLAADTGIKLGERWLNSPFTLRRSEEPVELTFVPKKSRSFSYRVVPSRDMSLDAGAILKDLHISMKKRKTAKADANRTSTQSGRSGNLSSNPFRLKSNPFPTGE